MLVLALTPVLVPVPVPVPVLVLVLVHRKPQGATPKHRHRQVMQRQAVTQQHHQPWCPRKGGPGPLACGSKAENKLANSTGSCTAFTCWHRNTGTVRKAVLCAGGAHLPCAHGVLTCAPHRVARVGTAHGGGFVRQAR